MPLSRSSLIIAQTPASVVLITMPAKEKGTAKDKDAAQPLPTLANRDYGADVNPVAGFVKHWEERDAFVEKASIVYTVHEMMVARQYAWEVGTRRYLTWEEMEVEVDDDGHIITKKEWRSDMEVWGNYELSDGGTIHGWYIVKGRTLDQRDLDFIAQVHLWSGRPHYER